MEVKLPACLSLGVAGRDTSWYALLMHLRQKAAHMEANQQLTEDVTTVTPYIFLQFSQDFSREKFFSSFHTNFLEKKILEKIPVNFCSRFLTISHEFSRLFLRTFLSTVPKNSDFRSLKA
jgi:hypothetical protein